MQFVHNHALLDDRTGFEDFGEPERRRHLLRPWLATPCARELPPAFKKKAGIAAGLVAFLGPDER